MALRKSTIDHLECAARAALDKLGKDLVAIDLSEQMVLSEAFLLVSGQNERQINAIADEVERQLGLVGEKPVRRERSASRDARAHRLYRRRDRLRTGRQCRSARAPDR